MTLPRIHVLRRIEASAIALATAGAASGLNSVKPAGIPLDRLGMWADIIAGSFAAGHFVHHKRARIRRWLRLASAANSLDDQALPRERFRQALEDCATDD